MPSSSLKRNLDPSDQSEFEKHVRLYDALRGRGFPVFIDPNVKPAFRLERGRSCHKVMLTSIPKSGTYLFGEVLKNLGFVDTGVHIEGENGEVFTDYRFRSVDEAAEDPHSSVHPSPLSTTLEMIRPGQYVVGHLMTDDVLKCLEKGFKVAFAYRNLRDCLVTLMLYLLRTAPRSKALSPLRNISDRPGRALYFLKNFGGQWLSEIPLVLGILDEPRVLKLRFEDMVDQGNSQGRIDLMNRLVDFLELDLDRSEQMTVCQKSLTTRTLTKSASRTNIEDHWNADVEREFDRLGGSELNRRLGYE